MRVLRGLDPTGRPGGPDDYDKDTTRTRESLDTLFADFDKEGFGEAWAMIFTRPLFKDWELVRRLLLTGRSRFPVTSCVDNYNVAASVVVAGNSYSCFNSSNNYFSNSSRPSASNDSNLLVSNNGDSATSRTRSNARSG